jgi:hypothetical protein
VTLLVDPMVAALRRKNDDLQAVLEDLSVANQTAERGRVDLGRPVTARPRPPTDPSMRN